MTRRDHLKAAAVARRKRMRRACPDVRAFALPPAKGAHGRGPHQVRVQEGFPIGARAASPLGQNTLPGVRWGRTHGGAPLGAPVRALPTPTLGPTFGEGKEGDQLCPCHQPSAWLAAVRPGPIGEAGKGEGCPRLAFPRQRPLNEPLRATTALAAIYPAPKVEGPSTGFPGAGSGEGRTGRLPAPLTLPRLLAWTARPAWSVTPPPPLVGPSAELGTWDHSRPVVLGFGGWAEGGCLGGGCCCSSEGWARAPPLSDPRQAPPLNPLSRGPHVPQV